MSSKTARTVLNATFVAAGFALSTTAQEGPMYFEPVYIDRVPVNDNGTVLLHLASAPALNPSVNVATCSTQGYFYGAFGCDLSETVAYTRPDRWVKQLLGQQQY